MVNRIILQLLKLKGYLLIPLLLLFVGCDDLFFPEDGVAYSFHPNYSQEYMDLNRGEYRIEIPEVQELVHIIIAITPVGLEDNNLVQHNTAYYKSIINHFQAFSSEPIVHTINQMLINQKYYYLKMDACGFDFNQQSLIVKNDTYNTISWGLVNHIDPLVTELESFAKKTNFRQFYENHQVYYQTLIDLLDLQTATRNQWNWLEERSLLKYDHYWITFSPLVGGAHSTNRFETTEFKETAMFISGPIENSRYNEAVTNALMTRVLFTEIDHNYVNPVSDQYAKDINRAFAKLNKWSSNSTYGSAKSSFNEYMTWAVFTLFAYDHLSEADFAIVNPIVENQMVNSRGFLKFKSFNNKLLELYKQQKTPSIEDLYPAILEWCENQ